LVKTWPLRGCVRGETSPGAETPLPSVRIVSIDLGKS
jgi:hypothetical protein